MSHAVVNGHPHPHHRRQKRRSTITTLTSSKLLTRSKLVSLLIILGTVLQLLLLFFGYTFEYRKDEYDHGHPLQTLGKQRSRRGSVTKNQKKKKMMMKSQIEQALTKEVEKKQLKKQLRQGKITKADLMSMPITPESIKVEQYYRERLQNNNLTILIVGGSDGSGTRGMVDILQHLGIDMIVEDIEQGDIHATQMFHKEGWPPLVELALKVRGGNLNYKYDDFHEETKLLIEHNIQKLLNYLKYQYIYQKQVQYQRYQLNKRKQELLKGYDDNININTTRNINTTTITHGNFTSTRTTFTINSNSAIELPSFVTEHNSNQIVFGFKAPVTMLLLPILIHIIGKPIKFIHVIRDGRDVALSSNQSPVQKFYNFTYSNDYQQRHEHYQGNISNVKAMQLWNDWNVQVYQWAQNNSHIVDYMLVRTEDLVEIDTSKRFECLLSIAEFVNSTKSIPDICCLNRKPPTIRNRNNNSQRGRHKHKWYEHHPAFQQQQQQQKGNTNKKKFNSAAMSDLSKKNYERSRTRAKTKRKTNKDNEDTVVLTNRRLLTTHSDEEIVSTIGNASTNSSSIHRSIDRHRRLLVSFATNDTETITKSNHNNMKQQQQQPSRTDLLMKRYGKWQKVLEENPLLAKYFYSEGEKGLQLFGYHPYHEIQYKSAFLETPSVTVNGTINSISEICKHINDC